jgi:hypothetical protein
MHPSPASLKAQSVGFVSCEHWERLNGEASKLENEPWGDTISPIMDLI